MRIFLSVCQPFFSTFSRIVKKNLSPCHNNVNFIGAFRLPSDHGNIGFMLLTSCDTDRTMSVRTNFFFAIVVTLGGGVELCTTQFPSFTFSNFNLFFSRVIFSIFPIFGQIEYNMVSIFSKKN